VASTPDGKTVPVTSNMRRAKAVWNIASERGLTVGSVGWWVTWPAEPVRGFMCSDYTWPLKKDDLGFATGVNPNPPPSRRTHPPGLMNELERFINTEDGLTPEQLAALGLTAIPKTEGYALHDIMLKDVSLADMSVYLLEKYQPDLFAIYFDGFDAFCHRFWIHYKQYLVAMIRGRSALADLSPAQRDLGAAIHAHLGRIDACLGKLMHRAGPKDVVMVISDHGYGDNPGSRPLLRTYDDWIQPPHWHTLSGIIAAAGGPIRQGADISEASVRDVTPTILALLGLPVARDMDGKVLTEMLKAEFTAAHPVQWVGTYETARLGGPPIESPYDKEALARLRSLGYLDD
jgi:predicted AlkP superfamily phosphohydrolase/phosphomutase